MPESSEDQFAVKDRQIDALILRAEELVKALNQTVSDMKTILNIAATDIQEAKDEQQQQRQHGR